MIDSHVHLNRSEFEGGWREVVDRAAAAGVTGFLNVGYDLATSRESIRLAEADPRILATVGIHPHDAAELSDAAVATLAAWVRDTGIRADVIVSLRLTGTVLAETLADHLRKVGKREGDSFPVRMGDPPTDATGAVEAAYWRDHLGDPPDVAGRAVLLVVDANGSGWPITLAAAALREAGATAVLPLLIHRTV